MPYEIVKQGGKFLLRNKKTKRVLGKHPSMAKAKAQMRAVYLHAGSEATASGSEATAAGSEAESEPGGTIAETLVLTNNQPVNPHVLVRQADGRLAAVTPHQARQLFLASAQIEHSQGRRVENRRTKLS